MEEKAGQKVLFISGSIGMGHVTRDLEIANALRKLRPNTEIVWMAEDVAGRYLRDMGEVLLPDCIKLSSSNAVAENHAADYKMTLSEMWFEWIKSFPERARIYCEAAKREKVDLVIADETYDLFTEMEKHPEIKQFPYVLILDFIGVYQERKTPMHLLGSYIFNRQWCNFILEEKLHDGLIFIGEKDDVPHKKFGLFLPDRHEVSEKYVDFVGFAFPFDPKDYSDPMKIKSELGYGKEPLVICSVGGTAAAKPLLDLCAKAYPIAKKTIPNLKMVLVGGPRIAPESILKVEGVEIKGYVPQLYKHLAAADLCITAGGFTTLEITALNRPFLYFPLEKHFEQQIDVGDRLIRHKAGKRMTFSETTPEMLAEQIVDNIGKNVEYIPLPLDGARKSAEIIANIMPA
jgi:predicted glycosyltransferase